MIRVVLSLPTGNQPLPLFVLADTGAGNRSCRFDLILEESDCILCGGFSSTDIRLGGALAGTYPLFQLQVQVPELGFDAAVSIVGVPANPPGFDGIAGFRFLNRFSYGNFKNPNEFGLET
jgi:hypothetical protein